MPELEKRNLSAEDLIKKLGPYTTFSPDDLERQLSVALNEDRDFHLTYKAIHFIIPKDTIVAYFESRKGRDPMEAFGEAVPKPPDLPIELGEPKTPTITPTLTKKAGRPKKTNQSPIDKLEEDI